MGSKLPQQKELKLWTCSNWALRSKSFKDKFNMIWCSKGHRRDGFWVKGLMRWLVQVAKSSKSFLRTSFFDLSLVSIAIFLKRGSYHKKKGFDKGFSTTGSSLIRPGNALFWPAIKKDVFFCWVGGSVLKIPIHLIIVHQAREVAQIVWGISMLPILNSMEFPGSLNRW